MSDLQSYLTGQIAHDVREIKDAQREQSERLDRIRRSLEELTSWAQRLALLAVLWGAALGLNLAPEKVADLVGPFLKSIK